MVLDQHLFGTGIVAQIAGDLPYWRLNAGPVAGWFRTLPPSAVESGRGRGQWIGREWDGLSDVDLTMRGDAEGDVVTAREILEILRELTAGIAMLEASNATAPTHRDVRFCFKPQSAPFFKSPRQISRLRPCDSESPNARRPPIIVVPAGSCVEAEELVPSAVRSLRHTPGDHPLLA